MAESALMLGGQSVNHGMPAEASLYSQQFLYSLGCVLGQ
jgi:hypothetical protein